ncbi:zinc finger CCCH domain-containing protein 19-like [Silene latifolia]|uniref:zinc finger CCCH domain-containing protein 19-like n=1 Tax=Silene latifolia TaxID=37657 RepID=UPI003D76B250
MDDAENVADEALEVEFRGKLVENGGNESKPSSEADVSVVEVSGDFSDADAGIEIVCCENEVENVDKLKEESDDDVNVENANVNQEMHVRNEEVIEKDKVVVLKEEKNGENANVSEQKCRKNDEDDVEIEEEGKEMENSTSVSVTKDDESTVKEEIPITDIEMDLETETKDSEECSGGKRKRGRNAKAVTAVVGEDVCFICLDGGDLVLCDRRGCPKAYHPSCIDHDEEFFNTNDHWTCGWHLCNQCGKNAYFMCYTCQFSLCRTCSKDAAISSMFSIRRNKGFCESCMKIIMAIENCEHNETGQDIFSDTSSWEYLFKDYWLEQKEKLCITSDELSQAKHPSKDSGRRQTSIKKHEGNIDAGGDSESSLGHLELSDSKQKDSKRNSVSVDYDTEGSSENDARSGKRKSRRRIKSQTNNVNSDSDHSSPDSNSRRGKKGRTLSKSRSKGGNYVAADDCAEGNAEWASKELLEFVKHMRNGNQSVLNQFDVQGLLLKYIKRNKLRDPRHKSKIICDSTLQKIFGKSQVGHFEMLKLLESHLFLKDIADNQGSAETEMEQLDASDDTDSLQGGRKRRGRKQHKRGEERRPQSILDDNAAIDMHNINLIFLHRNLVEALLKKPEIFHDKVVGSFVRIRIPCSGRNQDNYRLVQIIGTSKAAEFYKVGKRTTKVMLQILNLDKMETISMDLVSNQDFSEEECKRLRQSVKCGLIKRMTVGDIEKKARELQEARVVDWLEAEIVRLTHLRDRASEKGRKKELRECVEKLQLFKTPEERQRRLAEIPKVHADLEMDSSSESEDEMDSPRQVSDTKQRETGFKRKGRDYLSSHASSDSWSANARSPNNKPEPNSTSLGKVFQVRREDSSFTSLTREHTLSNGVDKGTPMSNSSEKPRLTSESRIRTDHSGIRSDLPVATMLEPPRISSVAGQKDSKVNETEKMWHYRDPTGKVQGPFSITQLRKWSDAGYFPPELRVWKISQSESDSSLLTNILAGKFDEEVPSVGPIVTVASSIKNESSKTSINSHSSGTGFHPPTTVGSSFQSSSQVRGGIERLPSTPTCPSDPRSNVSLGITNSLKTGNQPLTAANSLMSQSNSGQSLSIVTQPDTKQNPSVYAHNQSVAHVARPEIMKAGMVPNNPNTVASQVSYGQLTAPSVSNQTPSNSAGHAGVPAQNAWGSASTNWTWGGQQQQLGTPNMVWAGPPTRAAMPGGTSIMGCSGVGPSPSGGSTNPGGVAPPRNTSAQGIDHNPNMVWVGPPTGADIRQQAGSTSTPGRTTTMGCSGAGGSTNRSQVSPQGSTPGQGGYQNHNSRGTTQNRQSSYSGVVGVCKFHESGHCKKGASCNYMHA